MQIVMLSYIGFYSIMLVVEYLRMLYSLYHQYLRSIHLSSYNGIELYYDGTGALMAPILGFQV